jgi:siroheme synthase-like protein
MGDYPIQPDLTEREVLVVGGNAAAETRVQQLLTTGAMVRVVSPTLTLRLSELVNQGIIEYRSGHFIASDLNGITLVMSTLSDPRINDAVQRAANWRKVLFSRLDEIPSGRMPVLTSPLHQGWRRAH